MIDEKPLDASEWKLLLSCSASLPGIFLFHFS